ncbi:MAG: D-alanyl-D-alanine carboxypeptidase family protein [Eubacteriales bacterium]|nr:D-alanyl-D-alanine carboxypeptidase family protein [Eubacteriales bacterium]
MKKTIAFLLAFLLVFTCFIPVHATELDDNEEATTEHPETTEYPDDPTRQPDLVANSAIIMDASTGKILFEKNAHEKKYPASITKIMTTLLALEANVDFNEVITMSENSIWGVERDSTLIGLDVGEKVTMGDLMFATMVKSANECAYAVAEYVGGDIENFATMMNNKAAELGCENTHFVTPNGLHDDEHYTTAYDMALITREALKYDQFRELSSTLSYTVPETNLADETRPLWNGNQMINPSKAAYYEYCEGGKTGYTTKANNTLMTYAKKDGLELICIIMDCDGNLRAYSDTRALYNYCFNNYMYYYPLADFSFDAATEDEEVSNSILTNYYSSLNHDMMDLLVDKNYSILVNKNIDTSDIVKDVTLYDQAQDNILGEINFYYADELIGTTQIKSSTPLLSSKMLEKEEKTASDGKVGAILKKVLFIIICVVLVLLILFILYLIITAISRSLKRGQRRRNYRRQRRRRRHSNDYYF